MTIQRQVLARATGTQSAGTGCAAPGGGAAATGGRGGTGAGNSGGIGRTTAGRSANAGPLKFGSGRESTISGSFAWHPAKANTAANSATVVAHHPAIRGPFSENPSQFVMTT